MRKIYIVVVGLFLAGQLAGQSYYNSLGLRMGHDQVTRSVGLTFQQRIMKKVTIEGIAQSDFKYNTTFHALIESHHSIVTRRLNYYVGAGFYSGVEQSESKDPVTNEIITTYGNGTFGTDIILGLEFTLLKYNFSIDYKPNFNLVGRDSWYNGQVGISARAVIIKESTHRKNQRRKDREKRKEERNKEGQSERKLPFFKPRN